MNFAVPSENANEWMDGQSKNRFVLSIVSLMFFNRESARSLSLFFIGVSLATAQVPTVEIFCKRQEMTSMIYTRFMFFIRYGWHFCNQTEKFFPRRLCPFGFSILSYLLSGFY